jgi:hypothetical protein
MENNETPDEKNIQTLLTEFFQKKKSIQDSKETFLRKTFRSFYLNIENSIAHEQSKYQPWRLSYSGYDGSKLFSTNNKFSIIFSFRIDMRSENKISFDFLIFSNGWIVAEDKEMKNFIHLEHSDIHDWVMFKCRDIAIKKMESIQKESEQKPEN